VLGVYLRTSSRQNKDGTTMQYVSIALVTHRARGRPKAALRAVSQSGRRFQAVVATTGFSGSDSSRCMASAGVMNPRVWRGLPLSSAATASRYSALWTERSVLLGKYWRSRPLVFSLLPRCQGECGSQK